MAEQDVYVGVWRDYSHDGLRQLTLTVPIAQGGYLISIMTLLVSLAGSRFWYITTYALHQLRAAPEKRTDPVHAQIQTMLRNSITSTGTITDAMLMGWAWSGTGMRVRRRLVPVVIMASACLLVFTLAGTFVSSLVTQKTPDVVVLATAPACGAWDIDQSKLTGQFAPSPEKSKMLSEDAMDARLYAKWFYADMPPSSVPSSRFPVTKLPYAKRMAPCPFAGEKRCVSNDTSSDDVALVLDTGRLSSHFHLGINAPPEHRVEIRKLLTCSPVRVDDYVDITMTEYGGVANLSRLINDANYTIALNRHSLPLTFNGYSAGCNWYSGLLKYQSWAAAPFDRNDADLSLCYVRQESVVYPNTSYDPLFLVNGSRYFDRDQRIYLGSNYINFIGCIDQMQFCNPVTGVCTNVSHPAQAWLELPRLDLNEYQWLVANRTTILTALTGTASYGLGSLGAAGLLARDLTTGDFISTSLPNDQWQKEARMWFETGLAMLQGHIIRFLRRIDKTSPMYGRFLVFKPLSEVTDESLRRVTENACANHKVTTTNRYQNFNFSALLAVVLCSFLVILISLLLEPAMMMSREARVTQHGEWRQKEWDTNSKFWLLRMAMESAGVGPWRQGGKWIKVSIPVVDRDTLYEHVKNREVEMDDFLLRGQR